MLERKSYIYLLCRIFYLLVIKLVIYLLYFKPYDLQWSIYNNSKMRVYWSHNGTWWKDWDDWIKPNRFEWSNNWIIFIGCWYWRMEVDTRRGYIRGVGVLAVVGSGRIGIVEVKGEIISVVVRRGVAKREGGIGVGRDEMPGMRVGSTK